MCNSFTFHRVTNQCRFFDRRSAPRFLRQHGNKDYYVLKASKCIPVEHSAGVLGDDEWGMMDEYTEHRAQHDDDDDNDDDRYGSFFARGPTPIHYDFHLRRSATSVADLDALPDDSSDEDDGAHDDPESSFAVAIVFIVVFVACSLAMAIGVSVVHAKTQKDAARDVTLGGSIQHSEGEPSEPGESVSVSWDQRALDGVAGLVAELGCDTELVQPRSSVPVDTASSEVGYEICASSIA